ncbi:MAG: hypothetical protein N3D84_02860 [Candidatus Woesearchaeota archaeon]|nr:hypothetical protein [Candidatus Woesearchaeota archaeon]
MDSLVLGLVVFTVVMIIIALISFILTFRKKPTTNQLHKDIKTLERSINEMKAKGMQEVEIIKNLSEKGFSSRIVELVIHEMHKPNSDLEKLEAFVKKQKAKGKPEEIIKEDLLDAGWSEEIIDLVLGLE